MASTQGPFGPILQLSVNGLDSFARLRACRLYCGAGHVSLHAHRSRLAALSPALRIVLDNSQSDQEFNFVFQGEDLTVPAGGARTLSSNYPIVVRFDRGNGSAFVARATPLTVGTVQIGVNAADNLWDLFPTNDNRREMSKLKPFNADGQRKSQTNRP